MSSPLKINKKEWLIVLFVLLSALLFSTVAFSIHEEHTRENGIECKFCHASIWHSVAVPTNMPDTDNRIRSPRFLYWNQGGIIHQDVDFGQMGDAEGIYVTGASNKCQNIDCHGENEVFARPPAIVTCKDCHFTTLGDTDDFVFIGDTPTMAKIDSNEWTTSGHGRPYTEIDYPSGNPPPADNIFTGTADPCVEYCHTKTVAHDESTTNPFRLTTAPPASDMDFSAVGDAQLDDNMVCMDCHDGTSGVNKALVYQAHINANHNLTKHTADTDGGNFCWDCHDPHGDANDYMIHDEVTKTSDGKFGIPVLSVTTVFSKSSGIDYDGPSTGIDTDPGNYDWADYVRPGPGFDGVCQVCHETPGAQGGVDNFNHSTYNEAHKSNPGGIGSRCTTCHKHNGEFYPSGCDACHNYVSSTCVQNLSFASNSYTGWESSGTPGDTHIRHVCPPVSLACSDCHGHDGDDPVAHLATPETEPVTPTFVTMDSTTINPLYWNQKLPSAIYNGDPLASATRKSCDNITCHYGKTPDWGMRVACTDPIESVIQIDVPADSSTVADAPPVDVQVSLTTDGGAVIGTAEYETSDKPDEWYSVATVDWDTSLLTVDEYYTVTARVQDPDCDGYFVYDESVVQRVACSDTASPSAILIESPATGSDVDIDTFYDITIVDDSGGVGNAIIANTVYETSDKPDEWYLASSVQWNTALLAPDTQYTITAKVQDPDCDGYDVFDTSVVTAKTAAQMEPFTETIYTMNPDELTDLGPDTTDAPCEDPVVPITSEGSYNLLERLPSCGGISGGSQVELAIAKNKTPITMISVNNNTLLVDVTINSFDVSATLFASATGMKVFFDLISYDPDIATGGPTSIYQTLPIDIPTSPTALGVTGEATGGVTVSNGMKLGLQISINNSTKDTINGTHFIATTVSPNDSRTTLTIRGESMGGEIFPAPPAVPGSVTDTFTAPPDETGGGVLTACNTCHQFGPDDDPDNPQDPGSAAQYYYASNGDHFKHGMTLVGGNNPTGADAGGTCDTCHSSDDLGTATNWSDNNHMTEAVDFLNDIDGGTYDDVSRECSDVNCHGEPPSTSPAWGTSGTCWDCHDGTETVDTKPVKDDGGLPSKVNQTEYESADPYGGHGRAGIGLACDVECHDASSAHVPKLLATNPFRLHETPTDHRQNIDALCLTTDCHLSLPVQHTKIITGSSRTWPFDPKCIDCHDPHGDTNVSMIRDSVNTPTSSPAPGGGSDSYGEPVSTDSLPVAVTFTDKTTGYGPGSYADSGSPGSGICEVCHIQTLYYKNDGTGAHEQGLCTDCHPHSVGGFKGKECFECHDVAAEDDTRPKKNLGVDTANQVDSDEWTSKGHGTLAIDLTCYQCHDPGVAHNPKPEGTNPFRLQGNPVDTDALCATCHFLIDIECHTDVVTASGKIWPFTPKCVDCHDPHGDLTSIKMIKNKINVPTDTAPTAGGSDAWGEPITTNSLLTAVTFTDNTAGLGPEAFADSGTPGSGICEMCHQQTQYYDNIPTGNPHETALCTGCHGHDAGFKGKDCLDCHTGIEMDDKPQVDGGAEPGDANPVDADEWTATGHGRDDILGLPLTCYQCHDSSALHDPKDGGDPFRLGTTGPNYAQNTDDLCLQTDCHDTAIPATHSVLIGKKYADWPFITKCVDCHDPHGDTNLYMIRSYINAATNNGSPGGGSDSYGTPSTTNNTLLPVTFTDETSGQGDGSYGDDGDPATGGICELCHQRTDQYDRQGTGAGTHYTTDCGECHPHDLGFEGSGGGPGSDCLSCHNQDQDLRRNVEPEFTTGAGHYQHGGDWSNYDPKDCELCHVSDHGDLKTIQMKTWDTDKSDWENMDTFFTPDPYIDSTSVNEACLSCHDGAGHEFYDVGGGAHFTETPPNIAVMWTSTGFTPYNKYADGGTSLPNTVPQLTKSYSPHNDVATNQAKADMAVSVVGCLECHPAHGSDFGSSVSTNTNIGNQKVVMLAGGFTDEEDLCWDCHVEGMDYFGDNGVGGDWEGTWNNPDMVATYKGGPTGYYVTSHFHPDSYDATGSPTGGRNTEVYCSTCHTVHGVKANEIDLQFRVPILRGTWLTSPYREDRAPGTSHTTPYGDLSGLPNAGDVFGPLPRTDTDKDAADIEPGGGYSGVYTKGWDGWFIDQNTFGTNNYITTVAPQVDSTQFAGLCLTTDCHEQSVLIGLAWKGHHTVAGWDSVGGVVRSDIFDAIDGVRAGVADALTNTGGSEFMMQYFGANDGVATVYDPPFSTNDYAYGTRTKENGYSPRLPKIDSRNNFAGRADEWGLDFADQNDVDKITIGYHKFPCSKCHNPHAARLPKLMRTNCLDNGESIKAGDAADDYVNDYTLQSPPTGSHTTQNTDEYQALVENRVTMNFEAVNCHSVAGSTSGGWNSITPW